MPEITVCPECGDDLESVDREAHANEHWSPDLVFKKLLSPKAAVRRALVLGEPIPKELRDIEP